MMYAKIKQAWMGVFGLIGLSTKELIQSCFVRRWHCHLSTPLLARDLNIQTS